jgi:chemotaxis protein CheX
MSLNLDISRSTGLTEELVAGYIIDATRELFSMMVMMEVMDNFPLKEPVHHFKCNITGVVGFAGTYSGLISINCPLALALKIASAMVGVDSEEVNDDLNDAIGEITNMLGGSVKRLLSKGGLDLKMSIPTVISGENYTINSLSDDDCVVVPFAVEEHTMLVGLTLKKDNI